MKVRAILVCRRARQSPCALHRYTQKTLLPLHERPVIDYALAPSDGLAFKTSRSWPTSSSGKSPSVGAGTPGERIHYVMEEEPLGVAYALSLARPHNGTPRLLVYFSDNITTVELTEHVERFSRQSTRLVACCSPGKKRILAPSAWRLTSTARSSTSWRSLRRPSQPRHRWHLPLRRAIRAFLDDEVASRGQLLRSRTSTDGTLRSVPRAAQRWCRDVGRLWPHPAFCRRASWPRKAVDPTHTGTQQGERMKVGIIEPALCRRGHRALLRGRTRTVRARPGSRHAP